jgi:hypothetical protein
MSELFYIKNKKIFLMITIRLFFVTSISLFPMISLAEYSYELIPRISVSQVYEDNIYLDNTDEESDYLTTISPGINMTISSLNKSLSIDYAPTWVWYNKEDQNDTVRHFGTVTFGQDLTQHLRFDLTDTYLKSEEPLEMTEEVEGVRTTRNTYQRNTGRASVSYQFGPENALTLGYGHSLLKNEDPALDDGTIQSPFSSITYWFDIKNGLELDYGLDKANFSGDDDAEVGDDYTGHATGIRYIHRFTPYTRGSTRYNLTTRNFEEDEDYKVHEGALGFEHSFSPNLSLFLEGGVFTLKNERSDDETGYSCDASLVKGFERGSFTIGGRSGWDEAYLEAERRGFTKYWNANTRLEYRLMERLDSYAGGSFRRDRNTENREWETWRGNCGLRLEFLRWFSLSLDYSHAERDDDVDTEDYRANRVMLLLTGSKPY